MKKTIGILTGILLVAGMVLLLVGNKKKANEQTQLAAQAGNNEYVTTTKVLRNNLDRKFSSNGVAQANSELNFMSEISGRVVEIYVDKGSKVRMGTPLLKIDSELVEADYKAALASYEALCKDEERFTRSNEAGGVTSQQLDNIRTQLVAAESRLTASRWKLDNAVVKAPIGGTINNRFVERGALIAPSAPLFEIVDDSRLKVTCNVPGSKIGLIAAGQRVTAVSSDAAGKEFTGVIRSIGVKTDRGLNYPVEVMLDQHPDLRAGMYMKVHFDSLEGQTGLLIPRKAVVGSVLSANVYLAVNGVAVRRDVKLGDMFGDMIEIVDGLEEGDEIIVSGLMNVSDGSVITIVKDK